MAYTPINVNMSTGHTEITGNITSATKWTTARTITVGNTGKLVDGSSNVSWNLNEIGVYSKSEVDSKVSSSGNGNYLGSGQNLKSTWYRGSTNHYNTSGKPIIVNCWFSHTKVKKLEARVNGVLVAKSDYNKRRSTPFFSFVVAHGSYFNFNIHIMDSSGNDSYTTCVTLI